MRLARWFASWIPIFVASIALAAGEDKQAGSDRVRIADGKLQVGLDRATGTLRELISVADGYNQLDDRGEPVALWQIKIIDGDKARELRADQAGPVRVEPAADGCSLRLVWDQVPETPQVRVEASVRLEGQGGAASTWNLAITKPAAMRVERVAFPRIPRLRERQREFLAVPTCIGRLAANPRTMLAGTNGKGQRLAWQYPGTSLTMQLVTYYQDNGPGLYLAADDTQFHVKTLALWGDAQKQIHLESVHTPEHEAVGMSTYRLPYGLVLGTFTGDWSTAAICYRELPGSRALAARGRLARGLTPEWVPQIGIWVWNRGRSEGVLPPAAVMARHVQAPVAVFWHWWHDCAYDDKFPEYLPPREGKEPFLAAMDVAHREGLHVFPYMNQRLWGTTAKSWTEEGAEAFASKGADGKVHPEVYNTFTKGPCAVMCLATEFWRSKYAGLAEEVLCRLTADGLYMDQACCPNYCYDRTHGHVIGQGRYWPDSFGLLSMAIRDRCASKGRIPLGGEFCCEAFLPYLDLMLTLDPADERTSGGASKWNAIPMFPAVYHTSTICYGSYGSLVYQPYDERWPAEKAPKERLTLLDAKFSDQFCLEQARSFIWGMQPMIPNFLPDQVTTRPEAIECLTRLVRTRTAASAYLVRGTWLQPPAIESPEREIDIARLSTYSPLVTSTKRVPTVLASAWRAADGKLGIAMASIHPEKLSLRVPVDAKTYGLSGQFTVVRIDHDGRQPMGVYQPQQGALSLDLPARSGCVLEFQPVK